MAEDNRSTSQPEHAFGDVPADRDGPPAPTGDPNRDRLRFWMAVLAIAAVCAAWRVHQFAELEPRTDQAFTTAWVRALINAERFWPLMVEGAGFADALIADEGSLLNILLRQIALANDLVFTVVGLAWFSLLTLPFGGTMTAQIVASVLAGTLALAVAAAIPRTGLPGRGSRTGTPPAAVGLLFLVLACGSSFLNLFSALGIHNFGVLMLVIGVLATERWMAEFGRKEPTAGAWTRHALIAAIHGFVYYSHYTNVFILLPATVLLLLTNTDWPRRVRLLSALIYGAGVALLLSPAVGLAVVAPHSGHGGAQQDFLTRLVWVFSQEGNTPVDWLIRAGRWFSTMAQISSVPALVFGLAGLGAMAKYDGLRLPAFVVAVHFGVGVIMSGYNQYERTGAYALPFIYLGAAWSLVWGWRFIRRRRAASERTKFSAAVGAAAILFSVHGLAQWPGFNDFRTIPLWMQDMLRSEGFRDVVVDVERSIPPGGVLIAWDYPLVHRFNSLSDRAGSDYRVARPVESLLRESRAGRLRDYAKRFRIDLREGTPTFLFAWVDQFDPPLQRDVRAVFGETGFGWSRPPEMLIERRMTWNSYGRRIGAFVLYRLR